MFSDKSTDCIHKANRLKTVGIEVLLVKPVRDTRSADIESHTQQRIECRQLGALEEVLTMTTYRSTGHIFVDEAQFFADLLPVCLTMVDDGKTVHVYGLDGTATQEPFGQMADLLPHCDTFVKSSALCMMCGDDTPAPFTICSEPLPGSKVRIALRQRASEHCTTIRHYCPCSALLSTSLSPS